MPHIGDDIRQQAQSDLHRADIGQALELRAHVDDAHVQSHGVAMIGVVRQQRVDIRGGQDGK